MTKLEPFYIYAVFGEDGETKHSGISYGEIDTKRPPTQAELREALLISATFAEDEYQWPAHSQPAGKRSEEHTSELQSLMRSSYAVFCLQKKRTIIILINTITDSKYI